MCPLYRGCVESMRLSLLWLLLMQKEVDAIHRSLSALGNVIDALTSPGAAGSSGASSFLQRGSAKFWTSPSKRSPLLGGRGSGRTGGTYGSPQGRRRHIPYRDSKLTFVLSNCLGGNAHTHIVATVDPSVEAFECTLATLKFSQRAKQVRNRPVAMESSTYLKASSQELQGLVQKLAERTQLEVARRACVLRNVRAGQYAFLHSWMHACIGALCTPLGRSASPTAVNVVVVVVVGTPPDSVDTAVGLCRRSRKRTTTR